MFAASAVLFLSLLSVTSEVMGKPLSFRREQALRLRDNSNNTSSSNSSSSNSNNNSGNSSVSFNNWNNVPSLSGFDNYNGQGNFDGSRNTQVVVKEVEVQCKTVQVEIVQQKLAILQEIAKRIITEQICDVQTQVITLAQHNGQLKVFQDDIQRTVVTRQIGYDQQIASKLTQLTNTDGSLSESDLGFQGSDVGKNLVVPSGNNWSNDTSPALASAALNATQYATDRS
ncbi:hypothetical protein FB45DRAFT_859127 [Roridomyces roridus]|uniref:Uncharacterized protein n=1 Tax=Roridomyces roridus TaxID=1738132 RepID=A0AAD7G132_9AGAR|nr:hypothetical protein FB45DRAFT_859127 [Roridomyces roridus]